MQTVSRTNRHRGLRGACPRLLVIMLAAAVVAMSFAGCSNAAVNTLFGYVSDMADMSASHCHFTVSLNNSSGDPMALIPMNTNLDVDARLCGDADGLQAADVNVYLKDPLAMNTFLTELIWTDGTLYVKLSDTLRGALSSMLQTYLGMQPEQAYIGADMLGGYDYLAFSADNLSAVLSSLETYALSQPGLSGLAGLVSAISGQGGGGLLDSITSSQPQDAASAIDDYAGTALDVSDGGSTASGPSGVLGDLLSSLKGDPFTGTDVLIQSGSTVSFNLNSSNIAAFTQSLLKFASDNLDTVKAEVKKDIDANHDSLAQSFSDEVRQAYDAMVASGEITSDQEAQQAYTDNINQSFAELYDQIDAYFADISDSLESAGAYMADNPDYNFLSDALGLESLALSVGKNGGSYSFDASVTAAGQTSPLVSLSGTDEPTDPFTLSAPVKTMSLDNLSGAIRTAILTSPDLGAYLVELDLYAADGYSDYSYVSTKSGVYFYGPIDTVPGIADSTDPANSYIIPARYLFEQFGETVGWDAANGRAYLQRGDKQILIPGENLGGKWYVQPSALAALGYSYRLGGYSGPWGYFNMYIYKTGDTCQDLLDWIAGYDGGNG